MSRTSEQGEKVKGAGSGYMQVDAYAQHFPDRVEFYAFLKGGTAGVPVHVTAPVLAVKDAMAWMVQRTHEFMENPGAREGVHQALQRKAIQAQGEPFWKTLLEAAHKTDKHVKMELDMLIGFHDGIANRDQLKGDLADVVVDHAGTITGLPSEEIVQADEAHSHDAEDEAFRGALDEEMPAAEPAGHTKPGKAFEA